MVTLAHLAGSEAASLIIVAPFILIVLLHRMCALWRDWATTRTYAAHQAALRTTVASMADLTQKDSGGGIPTRPDGKSGTAPGEPAR